MLLPSPAGCGFSRDDRGQPLATCSGMRPPDYTATTQGCVPIRRNIPRSKLKKQGTSQTRINNKNKINKPLEKTTNSNKTYVCSFSLSFPKLPLGFLSFLVVLLAFSFWAQTYNNSGFSVAQGKKEKTFFVWCSSF